MSTRRQAWTHGLTTVVGLELRQRVRSRRWWVALVVWFVLIGGSTLLMVNAASRMSDSSVGGPLGGAGPLGYGTPLSVENGPPEPSCDTEIITADDATTLDGCELNYLPMDLWPTSEPSYARIVCTADEDGVVRCQVAEWWAKDTTCYDTGAGPTCFRFEYLEEGGTRTVPTTSGPPRPDIGVDCTNTADGAAVCHVPADTWGTGTAIDPPFTCTIHPDHTASCVWDPVDGWTPNSGPLVLTFVLFFVLGLGLLVTPALTAGSINGDRHAGTLATLQATTLSATQIALGRLVGAWLTMLAFLVAALPWIATAVVVGGMPLVATLGCCAVLMLELAVMCAIGLGWSALFNRTSASNLLSYLTVVTLSILTVVSLALLTPLVTRNTQVEVWRLPADAQARYDAEAKAWADDWEATEPPPTMPYGECAWFTDTRSEVHTELIWWLLVPNPFVMVADAAPEPEIARTHRTMYRNWAQDPLFDIRESVTELAAGPEPQADECYDYFYEPDPKSPVEERDLSRVHVWPWSLAANLLLGGAFFAIAVLRLKVPYRKLPKGTRVA